MKCRNCNKNVTIAETKNGHLTFFHTESGWRGCLQGILSGGPLAQPEKGIYLTEAERLLLCRITEGYTAGGSMGEVLAKLHMKR